MEPSHFLNINTNWMINATYHQLHRSVVVPHFRWVIDCHWHVLYICTFIHPSRMGTWSFILTTPDYLSTDPTGEFSCVLIRQQPRSEERKELYREFLSNSWKLPRHPLHGRLKCQCQGNEYSKSNTPRGRADGDSHRSGASAAIYHLDQLINHILARPTADAALKEPERESLDTPFRYGVSVLLLLPWDSWFKAAHISHQYIMRK